MCSFITGKGYLIKAIEMKTCVAMEIVLVLGAKFYVLGPNGRTGP